MLSISSLYLAVVPRNGSICSIDTIIFGHDNALRFIQFIFQHSRECSLFRYKIQIRSKFPFEFHLKSSTEIQFVLDVCVRKCASLENRNHTEDSRTKETTCAGTAKEQRMEHKMISNERKLTLSRLAFNYYYFVCLLANTESLPKFIRIASKQHEQKTRSSKKVETNTQAKRKNIKVATQIVISQPRREKSELKKSRIEKDEKERKRKFSARNEIKMFIDEALRCVMTDEVERAFSPE